MVVAVAGWVGSCGAGCPWDDPALLPWSDPATWPAGSLPADGDRITLSRPVLLDCDTARLDRLDILGAGRLVLSPDHRVSHHLRGVPC